MHGLPPLFLVWFKFLEMNEGWCIASCPIHDNAAHICRVGVRWCE